MQPMRQKDVTVLPLAQTVGVTVPQELRKKLPNLTLAPRRGAWAQTGFDLRGRLAGQRNTETLIAR